MKKSQLRSGLAALAAGLLLLEPARAQNTDEDMCRNGLFPSQSEFHLATVAASASRLFFFNDWDGCPQKGASCQTKAYVVPGDRLLLGKTHGDWTCAWYEGKAHETVGWVSNRDLVLQTDAQDETSDFSGKWKQYDYPGYVSIARKKGSWYVLGEMRWSNEYTSHFGELSGELKVQGRHAHLGGMGPEVDDCIADLTRIGDFLVVHDNERCGALNVRFDGVYTRSR